ncbi:MAG: DUF2163 domain-containing protein [Pseudomonadota bacterium]
MSGQSAEFRAHTAEGITTLCRAWAIRRMDGVTFGFTDHDQDLAFDGITFKADTGLSAGALTQSTGLSVDNAEAIGAISAAAVQEKDIEAGRFDRAEVNAWVVNWQNPDVRWLQFRGHIGELRRAGGAFQAELRGLTEALNQPLGRVYQKPCTAVLGDRTCRFDTSAPGYAVENEVQEVRDGRVFGWDALSGFDAEWFTRGRLDVLTGDAAGLWGMVKSDRQQGKTREIELWEPIPALISAGDRVRLTAGCDKRFETCRLKFRNLVNFQGFPDLPGEDWVMAVPKASGVNSGGSRR